MQRRRHKNDSKTFEELNFNEQGQSMRMTALQFRKQLDAHLRRGTDEGRPTDEIREARLRLLDRILRDYRKPKK